VEAGAVSLVAVLALVAALLICGLLGWLLLLYVIQD